MVAAENCLKVSRGEESINKSLSHACSAYCDFYKNLMLVSNVIKKSLFYAIIGAYTCTFSNNHRLFGISVFGSTVWSDL